MSASPENNTFGRDYWDSLVAKPHVMGSEDFWRAHLKEIYQRMKERWRGNARPKLVLKTDLYDEAISTHNLIPLFGSQCEQIIGTDVSFRTSRAAKRRMADEYGGWRSIAVSDARNHAFKANAFDEVLSFSTLDHFPDRKDITESLRELRRILRPGGTLIITFDNPWNPVIFVRNRLPYRLLRFLGVIPFYMGVTLSRPELIRDLESNGFQVCDSTAIVHSPRIFAIRVGHLLDRTGREGIRAFFHRLLRAFEALEALPTKYVTGYYVAVKAVKS